MATRFCTVDGCDKAHQAKGLCGAHYMRLFRHGDPLGGGTSPGEPQEFYRNIVLPYAGKDCLTWPFSRNAAGYGRIWVDGGMRTVSRRVCEEVNGPPPTPKHEAAHSCGKGHLACVTKGHLSWKTPKENCADRIIHGPRSER